MFYVVVINMSSHPTQITEDIRIEEALTQLLEAVKEGQDKHDILLINSPSRSQLECLIDVDL